VDNINENTPMQMFLNRYNSKINNNRLKEGSNMNFTKMHGLGNDFIVIADQTDVHHDVHERAVRVCDRKFGIGADGLVYILPSEVADFRMRIFNADGSEPEQCGNAIRCVGKYLYDHKMTDQTTVTVETKKGIQTLQLFLHPNGSHVEQVRVDMGAPILAGEDIPTTIKEDTIIQHPIALANGEQQFFTAISMGNPHCVIFVDALEQIPFEQWGPYVERHPFFPNRTNTEFVQVHSRKEVTMRVWERGCGETFACGTGACAVGVAGVLTGQTDRVVTVHLKGGDLLIEWAEDDHVYMTGSAVEVFQGKWIEQ
jgi:diaminopimelate epimerase